jgi:SAM-dependent methyltransferase
MANPLESFYEHWQAARSDLIEYDNACATRKVATILRNVPELRSLNLRSALDFGCGRGRALGLFADELRLERAYGFDFSEAAVSYATRTFGTSKLQFHRLGTLEIDASIESIKAIVPEKVDCVLLLDLLEHVADCKHLVARLSELATYFVIKLPVEANLLDNYVLRHKQYPSVKQYNGHLREFNANTVFYFVRQLGLTPLAEDLYLYVPEDMPPQPPAISAAQSLKRGTVAVLRTILAAILPKKLFIAVCGPGAYYCVATFDHANVLNP